MEILYGIAQRQDKNPQNGTEGGVSAEAAVPLTTGKKIIPAQLWTVQRNDWGLTRLLATFIPTSNDRYRGFPLQQTKENS